MNWISVEDKLPEHKDEYYLCYADGEAAVGRLRLGKWFKYCCYADDYDGEDELLLLFNVTHWCEITSPENDC